MKISCPMCKNKFSVEIFEPLIPHECPHCKKIIKFKKRYMSVIRFFFKILIFIILFILWILFSDIAENMERWISALILFMTMKIATQMVDMVFLKIIKKQYHG